jgi:hypothetical protein
VRQDILAVLSGHAPGRLPWTIHHDLLPRGTQERRLRGLGLAIVDKSVRPYREGAHRVSVDERAGWDGQARLAFRTWHTPCGDLEARLREGPDGSTWTEQYPVRGPSDFRVLSYISDDTEYRENNAAVADAQAALADDGLVLCRMMRSPVQRLLTEWMGPVGFSCALADDGPALGRLVESLAARDGEAFAVAARSPAEAVWSAENLTGDMVGPDMFRRWHAPYYDRAARMLGAAGKLYGVHMDGRLASLRDAVGACAMDFVEGFTPPPMGNLALAEARTAWPGKALWVNIPGTVFLGAETDVLAALAALAAEAAAARRCLLTLTEEFPDPPRSLGLLGKAMTRAAGC